MQNANTLRSSIFLFSIVLISVISSCNNQVKNTRQEYPKAYVDFSDYESLVDDIKPIRAGNLISYDELLEYSLDPKTVLLDTRSQDKFLQKHLAGAVNLPFTEFTQSNLRSLIPDVNTRIIIYCNNNFKGDPILFPSKTLTPETRGLKSMVAVGDSIMLALNIPTYINLYGYGYRNIFELDELVDIQDPRLKLEGSAFPSLPIRMQVQTSN